ncbi:lipoprotein-releasing ABC transporter permease subunit LolE [Seminibacterium arietis]|uniref:Lipoprotein-releasing ABC transporter permease subunit LolE n=1 Tax=Seminibacterium arietis TaxID=1173502 RepID=A0ABW3I7F5_9PAST
MSHPFFISLRYQQVKQKNPLVSLISAFSLIGIALGVAVLILGLSAMNGFERELNNRILAVVPHAEIFTLAEKGGISVIEQRQNLTALLQQNPQIVASSPFVSFSALIENGTKLKVVQIKGVAKKAQDKVSQLGQYVLEQNWQKFDQQGGLILGNGIAKELGVKVGDVVTLLISKNQSNASNNKFEQPERYSIYVTGILRLDGQLDHSYALMPLKQAQQLLGYNSQQINGIEIKVQDPFKISSMRYAELQDYPQRLAVQNWSDKFGYMYRDIQLIRAVMYISMILVISVACFNVVSTLIMAVKDKQSDIAVLRTLGANNGFVRQIFIFYGLLVGMKGCIIGTILGIVLSLNLTALIQALESIIGKKLLSDGVYFVDFLPSELHWQDVLLVLLATLMLSLLASLYPANRAAKLQPAQVLSNY